MDKIIALILSLFMLTSCVKSKEGVDIENNNGLLNLTTHKIEEINGCTYKYISHFNGGVTVVNLTKDSLEMEYYKSQIEMNNKYFNDEI